MAGAEGIEPSSAVLETDILPLNYAPRNCKKSVFLYRTHVHSLRQDSTQIQKIKRKYYIIFYQTTQDKNPFLRHIF